MTTTFTPATEPGTTLCTQCGCMERSHKDGRCLGITGVARDFWHPVTTDRIAPRVGLVAGTAILVSWVYFIAIFTWRLLA